MTLNTFDLVRYTFIILYRNDSYQVLTIWCNFTNIWKKKKKNRLYNIELKLFKINNKETDLWNLLTMRFFKRKFFKCYKKATCGIFLLFGPPAVAGRFLWIRVCPSFRPSVRKFSWDWLISFFWNSACW